MKTPITGWVRVRFIDGTLSPFRPAGEVEMTANAVYLAGDAGEACLVAPLVALKYVEYATDAEKASVEAAAEALKIKGGSR